ATPDPPRPTPFPYTTLFRSTERRRAELGRTDGVVPTGSRRPAVGQSDDATDAPRAADAGARFPQRVVRDGAPEGFARGRRPRGDLPGALLSWDGFRPHPALFAGGPRARTVFRQGRHGQPGECPGLRREGCRCDDSNGRRGPPDHEP